MTDMSKVTPEHIEQAVENLKAKPQVKQDSTKQVLQSDFDLEISLPSMTTPHWMVWAGLVVVIVSKSSVLGLAVGGGVMALAGLIEFVDRRWPKGRKIHR